MKMPDVPSSTRVEEALAIARGALSNAARETEPLDGILLSCERQRAAFTAMAAEIRDTDPPAAQLWSAQEAAESLSQRIESARQAVDVLRGSVRQGTEAIDAGLRALRENDAPDGAAGLLQARLAELGQAASNPQASLDDAYIRLGAGLRELAPFLAGSGRTEQHDLVAATIAKVGLAIGRDLTAVRRGLEAVRNHLSPAQMTSEELAAEQRLVAAARAALNPTANHDVPAGHEPRLTADGRPDSPGRGTGPTQDPMGR